MPYVFLRADLVLSSFLDFIGHLGIGDYSLNRVSVKSGEDHFKIVKIAGISEQIEIENPIPHGRSGFATPTGTFEGLNNLQNASEPRLFS